MANWMVNLFFIFAFVLMPLHWFLIRFSTPYLVRWCRMKRRWQRMTLPPFEV